MFLCMDGLGQAGSQSSAVAMRSQAAALRAQAQALPPSQRNALLAQAAAFETQASALEESGVPTAGVVAAGPPTTSIISSIVQGILQPIAQVGTGVYTAIESQRLQKKVFDEQKRAAQVYEQQRQRELEIQRELEKERLALLGPVQAQTVAIGVGGLALVGAIGMAVWALRKPKKG